MNECIFCNCRRAAAIYICVNMYTHILPQAPWHFIRHVLQTCCVVTNTPYCGSRQSPAIAWWRPPRLAHGNCGWRKFMVYSLPAPHDRSRLRPPAMYPDVASLSASIVYARAHCRRQMVSAFGATTAPNIIEYMHINTCWHDCAAVALRRSAQLMCMIRI